MDANSVLTKLGAIAAALAAPTVLSAAVALGAMAAPAPWATASPCNGPDPRDPCSVPICDPTPTEFENVAPCEGYVDAAPAARPGLEGDPIPLGNGDGTGAAPDSAVLPYCAVPLMLLPDTAAVGGKSWQCLAEGLNTALDDPLLPYCPAPLVLVPDLAAVGGQRWQCPVSTVSLMPALAPRAQ